MNLISIYSEVRGSLKRCRAFYFATRFSQNITKKTCKTGFTRYSIYPVPSTTVIAIKTNINESYLVSTQHDRNVLAHSCKVSVPVGNVLVCDTAGHVKHDDRTLSLDAAPPVKRVKHKCDTI